jgi:hypothetical protein
MTIGLLEAMTAAIGEADTDIGGLYKTRLTSALTTGTEILTTLLGTWTWDGTTTVLATNTSQVATGNWIQLDSDGQFFKITAITPNTDVTIENPGSLIIPSGATGSSYYPLIWDGTLVVVSKDTSGLVVGDWIRLDSDGQYFQITSIIVNTSVTILNPNSFTIPGTVASPLSTRSSKAVVVIPVETTLNWDSSGIVSIEGIVYHYTGTTVTSFTGVTHIAGGISRPGVFKIHRDEAPVVDLNRSRNAIDLVWRAMLVDYAEEEYLDALGRNHGVSRTPYLTGDDTTFRKVVKALSYNPRGTIYGMELALDALVGAGNHEIAEDLISNPCTVYISLVGSASSTLVSKGKAFIKDVESQPATSNTTVDVSRTPIAVGSVRWKDENLVTQTQTQKPSAVSLDEYDGDTGRQAWDFISAGGGSEANNVILQPVTTDSGCIEFTTAVDNNDALYRHFMARIQPESNALLEVVATIPVGVNIHAAEANQAALAIFDTTKGIGAGCIQIDAANFGVGLSNPIAGTLLAGSAVTLAKGTYHTIAIHKTGQNDVELHVNGIIVQTATYASFPASGGYKMEFGILINPPTNNPFFRVRQVAMFARTLTDYWNARASAGQVAAANPTRLNDAGFNDFQTTDVGNALSITGGTASSGINNGRFVVASRVSATAVELTGAQQTKADIGSDKLTVTVPLTGYQFQYPDDIGKKITVSGSSLGNDGDKVIGSLLSQQSGNHDLATLPGGGPSLSSFRETTNICKVTVAFASAETDVDWLVKPVFVNEGPGLNWEMSDACSFSGATLTLRQALPIGAGSYTRVLDILFSDVLSAQVLLDTTIKNLLDAYYPFYIADPLGFVRAYLDAITAAGVIPDFEYT